MRRIVPWKQSWCWWWRGLYDRCREYHGDNWLTMEMYWAVIWTRSVLSTFLLLHHSRTRPLSLSSTIVIIQPFTSIFIITSQSSLRQQYISQFWEKIKNIVGRKKEFHKHIYNLSICCTMYILRTFIIWRLKDHFVLQKTQYLIWVADALCHTSNQPQWE